MQGDRTIETAEIFECSCHTPEHTLVFNYLSGKDYSEVYASVFLSSYRGFFGRCWSSLKYIFGYKPCWGHFDCFTLRNEDLDRIIHLLERYKDDIEKNNPTPP